MVADTLSTAPHRSSLHRTLIGLAAALALVVIGLGAYVRLSDAGLGCPDWPGCYGHLVGVPDAAHEVVSAAQAFPGQPVHTAKAWKEMIHRYAAGTLGLLVLAIAVTAWQRRRKVLSVENGLLGLIVLQAALGMWTVTLLLKPVIVTLHLLGGMATWATLIALLRDTHTRPGLARVDLAVASAPASSAFLPRASPPISPSGRFAIGLVFGQIALGGWVSSNYAALACNEFPTCLNGNWWPAADFAHGFTLLRELGSTGAGDALPFAALTAIHLAHRIGALLVLLVVGRYGFGLWLAGQPQAAFIIAALALQLALGIGNVLLSLPLPVAVLHNLGAATLLATLILVRSKSDPVRA